VNYIESPVNLSTTGYRGQMRKESDRGHLGIDRANILRIRYLRALGGVNNDSLRRDFHSGRSLLNRCFVEIAAAAKPARAY
jgi:hypothetical protein